MRAQERVLEGDSLQGESLSGVKKTLFNHVLDRNIKSREWRDTVGHMKHCISRVDNAIHFPNVIMINNCFAMLYTIPHCAPRTYEIFFEGIIMPILARLCKLDWHAKSIARKNSNIYDTIHTNGKLLLGKHRRVKQSTHKKHRLLFNSENVLAPGKLLPPKYGTMLLASSSSKALL